MTRSRVDLRLRHAGAKQDKATHGLSGPSPKPDQRLLRWWSNDRALADGHQLDDHEVLRSKSQIPSEPRDVKSHAWACPSDPMDDIFIVCPQVLRCLRLRHPSVTT